MSVLTFFMRWLICRLLKEEWNSKKNFESYLRLLREFFMKPSIKVEEKVELSEL